MRIRALAFLILTTVAAAFAATQSTPYILTDFPLTLVPADSAVWVKWTGLARPTVPAPDSGRIYFASRPGGSIVANYSDSVTVFAVDTLAVEQQQTLTVMNNVRVTNSDGALLSPLQRGIKFRPSAQKNMGAGVYYFIVAWHGKTLSGNRDTVLFWSNEQKMIVKTSSAVSLQTPLDGSTISEVTPILSWAGISGVPYYHVMVSDKAFEIDTVTNGVKNLSIIWEAITGNTQITYGAPDPSGTITANPPPMTPGKKYNWMVLPNYGNHPAYSSFAPPPIPRSFTLSGVALTPPDPYTPTDDTLSSTTDSVLTFKWKHTRADSANLNTYKIYLYVNSSDMAGIEAKIVVWSDEVTAGAIVGDTGRAVINAKAVLTRNSYTWKVIAVDKQGFGSSGEEATFRYDAPTGTLHVHAAERITVDTSVIEKAVSLAEVDMEVLDGSMEAPLLFYTDNSGNLWRTRPAGRYRMTFKRDGFLPASKTINLGDGALVDDTIYMSRPDATVFGKVVDNAGFDVGSATVYGASDNGDTVAVESDTKGNFVLSCSEAQWKIWAAKPGYVSSLSRDTAVVFGQSVNLGAALVVSLNPISLYGTVRNDAGQPLVGATVQILRDGVVLSQILSTPSSGNYSFALQAGTYTLKAFKTGFTSYQSAASAITSSSQRSITLAAGAALVRGYVVGKTWNGSAYVFAPIPNATVYLVDTARGDTVSGVTDRTYGNFGVSATGGRAYMMHTTATGYAPGDSLVISAAPGATLDLADTLTAFATLSGQVNLAGGVGTPAGVSVSLIDSVSGAVVMTAKTDVQGTYEIAAIPDAAYLVSVGREGLVLDSVVLKDISGNERRDSSIVVQDGIVKADNGLGLDTLAAVNAVVEAGSKNIRWLVLHEGDTVAGAQVKVTVPFQKTVPAGEYIESVGLGVYRVASQSYTSVINCYSHSYTMEDGVDSIYSDTIRLPFEHNEQPVVAIDADGMVSCTLSIAAADTAADSTRVYYRDINATVWLSAVPDTELVVSGLRLYVFRFAPDKDASYMNYWFRAYRGSDVFGSDFRTFRTFVEPNPRVLSRIEVSPGSEDSLLFPGQTTMRFVFKGYYGSTFVPAKTLNKADVKWSMVSGSSFGCSPGVAVADSEGVALSLTTGGSTGTDFAVLQAIFSSSSYSLAAAVSDTVRVMFRVSSGTLDTIIVTRVNDGGTGYLTTSPIDNGEYVATGIDSRNNVVSITPIWELSPASAGTLKNGLYTTSPRFAGNALISARLGSIRGEYNPKSGVEANDAGQKVMYLVPAAADTLSNGIGCSIALPSNLFVPGTQPLIGIARSAPGGNKLTQISGAFDRITDAYAIDEEEGAHIDSAAAVDPRDSTGGAIKISIAVPTEFVDDARSMPEQFSVGIWDEDSLQWKVLLNSEVASDGMSVTVGTMHFSKYAMLREVKEAGATFRISPNPFSPYVTPKIEYGSAAQPGTCFEIRAASKFKSSVEISVDIYTYDGTSVASAIVLDASSSQLHRIWWDGRMTSRKVLLKPSADGSETLAITDGGSDRAMCRNGRYFAVVTVNDSKEEVRYRKELILIK